MPIVTKPNVLNVLLEYINFQSEWQHETNIWKGLLFDIAVSHVKHS